MGQCLNKARSSAPFTAANLLDAANIIVIVAENPAFGGKDEAFTDQ
jgi:hypothetical protein